MEVKKLNIVVVFILIYFIHGFKSLEDLWNMNELTPFVSNNFREIFGDGEQFSDIDVRNSFILITCNFSVLYSSRIEICYLVY